MIMPTTNDGSCYGMISAFSERLGMEDNLRRHGELLDILLRNGYSPVEVPGGQHGIHGPFWMVAGIEMSELRDLGVDFGQVSVLWSSGAEAPQVYGV